MTRAVVEFSRGGHVESEHRIAWCVTGPDGRAVAGDADGPVFWRSAAKPFQALPAVASGILEDLGLGERHLAVACGSHGGGPEHLAAVREILAAAGLDEGHLGLGELEPRDPAEATALDARGEPPGRLTHNCSGKHALGLALCARAGWPVEGYTGLRHPLQEAMRGAVSRAAGAEPDDVRHGTDGCGMSTFHLPLRSLAAAFGRLSSGGLGEDGDRVAAAMRARPDLVGFRGAVDTELMAAEEGLVAKIGAEGVLAIGLHDGRGLALKVVDGAMRALDPAGVVLCREALGLSARSPALERLARPAVRNSRGETVGEGAGRLLPPA